MVGEEAGVCVKVGVGNSAFVAVDVGPVNKPVPFNALGMYIVESTISIPTRTIIPNIAPIILNGDVVCGFLNDFFPTGPAFSCRDWTFDDEDGGGCIGLEYPVFC
jgi:hypothetical protein